MSPKISREEREECIVQAARRLISADGFVNFKMSELAREAEMSVGTLYSHFPSKEDLLLGLHLHNLKTKEEMFLNILSNEKWSPLERLLAMTLSDWDLDRKMKELSEIDALSMFPSIWEKASPGITGQLEAHSRRISEVIKDNIDKVIDEEGIELHSTSIPTSVTLGVSLWGLGLGLHNVFRSFCLQKTEGITAEAEDQIAVESLAIMIKGLDAKSKMGIPEISKLFKQVQDITREIVS